MANNVCVFDYDGLAGLILYAEERLLVEKGKYERAKLETELKAYRETESLLVSESPMSLVWDKIISKCFWAKREVEAQGAPCLKKAKLVAYWKALERVKKFFAWQKVETQEGA